MHCGGQALDLAAEGQSVDLVQLEQIHRHKTGALIRAMAMNLLQLHQIDRLTFCRQIQRLAATHACHAAGPRTLNMAKIPRYWLAMHYRRWPSRF
jgi:hypothetical protein